MKSDLISRSALLKNAVFMTWYDEGGWDLDLKAVPVDAVENAPAVDAVEVVRCKDCTLWDREHIEMYQHSTERPEQQAEFAECWRWSTWDTCFMARSDDYCSQAKRRTDE